MVLVDYGGVLIMTVVEEKYIVEHTAEARKS